MQEKKQEINPTAQWINDNYKMLRSKVVGWLASKMHIQTIDAEDVFHQHILRAVKNDAYAPVMKNGIQPNYGQVRSHCYLLALDMFKMRARRAHAKVTMIPIEDVVGKFRLRPTQDEYTYLCEVIGLLGRGWDGTKKVKVYSMADVFKRIDSNKKDVWYCSILENIRKNS